jgi:hypothetical protein
MPQVNVVLVTSKASSNGELLPKALPRLIGPGTVVVMLQNGLGSEPQVTARLLPVPWLVRRYMLPNLPFTSKAKWQWPQASNSVVELVAM